MNQPATNPRESIGGNQSTDFAQDEMNRLEMDYHQAIADVTALLDAAREMPKDVISDEDVGKISDLAVKIKDCRVRLNGYREVEKQPHLRRGEGVDQFFFTQISKLAKRNKGDINGALDVLTARVNAYQTKKAEDERRIRLEDEERQRKLAVEAERVRVENERKQREAEEAAERARKPEKKAELQQQAQEHRVNAEVAKVTADAAQSNLSDAKVASQAKPADIVRSRSDGGTLATMRQVPFVEIVDASKLDREKLWPFIKEEHLLLALKAWGRVTGHKQKMEGAVVEMRNDTVFR